MNKTLGDIIKGIIVVTVMSTIYIGAQAKLYSHMNSRLQKIEEEHGIEYTIRSAQNTLEANISPLHYLFVPGPRKALVEYIQEHKISQEN